MANAQDHATSEYEDRDESGISGMVGEAGAAVQKAGRKAKKAASSIASDANERVIGLIDKQVGTGADMVGHIAGSIRTAADDLEQNEPRLAGFVRDAADRIDRFSDTIRDRTAGDLFRASSDFARRRPAVVFGGAALLGFLLYRVVSVPADRTNGPESWDEYDRESDFGEDQSRAGSFGVGSESAAGYDTSTVSQNPGGRPYGA